MTWRGFTVVELIITITIMGILLLLAVVNLNNSQMNARDAERTADVEAFALHLEAFYKTGKDANGSAGVGRYPSTGLINNGIESIRTNLRDIDFESITAPGVNDPLLTLMMATSTGPQTPTKDQYIYQPIQGNGTLCSNGMIDCRKFFIYYFLEGDSSVHVYKSKNQ